LATGQASSLGGLALAAWSPPAVASTGRCRAVLVALDSQRAEAPVARLQSRPGCSQGPSSSEGIKQQEFASPLGRV
jgi:hypothetical protein